MNTSSFDELLVRGVSNSIDEANLRGRLERGEPLRIKFGIDPTGPRIHIGRAVVLWKLRAFQELGHQILLIVGDFTAEVGDASDKTAERPRLSSEEVQKNLQGYLDQIGTILDITKCEIHYNSSWLQNLTFRELSELAGVFSVAEMLDRDNFSKRYHAGERISLHEFMYPLMQGYDSVKVKADIELGGNDQYFNLMAGRKIQKHYGQPPQDVITYEFLVGLDGRKMSTSWGNGIFINDTPQEMFGKVMTLQDQLILDYFRLATDETLTQIDSYSQQLQEGANPRDIKLELAKSLVRRYHSQEAADSACSEFIRVFAQKSLPDNMPEMTISLSKLEFRPVELVAEVFQVSKSESRRLLQASGIKMYPDEVMTLESDVHSLQGTTQVLQKGKRYFVKVTFE